jgi:hypothetical protein
MTTFLQIIYVTETFHEPAHLNSVDDGSTFLRNVDIHLKDYTVSESRKVQSKYKCKLNTFPEPTRLHGVSTKKSII